MNIITDTPDSQMKKIIVKLVIACCVFDPRVPKYVIKSISRSPFMLIYVTVCLRWIIYGVVAMK